MSSRRALTPALVVGFLAILVVLIATHFVGLAKLRTVYETSTTVAHASAVNAGLERLLATLVEVESGGRGFVITGQPAYLDPYDRARTAFSSDFGSLRALVADDPDQLQDLGRLSAASTLKLNELAEAVRQRQEAGFAAAQAAVADNAGRRIMDDIRIVVARMRARENALLEARTAQAERSYRSARTTRFATTGLALLSLAGLFYASRRFGNERVHAADNAERLRVTLASIGDAVIATDEQGRVTRLNPVAEALTGWTEADAAGKRLEEVFVIINEQTRAPVENPISKALREQVIVGLANHTVLIAKDGREIPVDDSAAPIKTADGNLTGAVMVFRDVSERRRVERERMALVDAERLARIGAESAEHRLRVALEAGRMGTWQWTMGTGDLKWSPGLEAIHGYAPGTFPGTFDAFRQEIHPDDRDRTLAAITGAVQHGRDHHVEYRIVRADGTTRWVEGRGQLFFDERGEPDHMVGVCADVTDRKGSEDRFRLAIEAAPTAMIVVDRHGTITYANALSQPLFGYTPDEIVGKSIEQLVPARFRDHHAEYRDGFAGDATRRPMGAGRDLFALRKDGSEVPVEIGLSPFETDNGAFAVAAVTDISERKQMEAALRQRGREAEHANHLKDRFLATVSHELRTPLNAVLGWADILQRGDIDGTKRGRALSAIYTNARRQVQLIDELLDVSRIISGKLRLERAAIDPADILRTAVDIVQPSADKKRVDLVLVADPSLTTVYADPGRLHQIVVNLLSNAIKFTPDGGAVHLRARRADSMVEVAVADTGQGIPSDFLPFVFEAFRQADGSSTRRHDGLGLGLSIVKHLVEAHGGTVRAESAGENQGSTFIVRLPTVGVILADNDAGLATSPSELPVVPPPVPGCLEALSVLVVDDDADGRALVAAALEHYGARVMTAASAAAALDLLQTRPFDVLLADIAMPDEDGYSLIRRLRASASPQHAAIPAAALTSFARDEDRQQAIQAGFQLHLAKPIDTRSLVQAVVNLSKGRQIRSN